MTPTITPRNAEREAILAVLERDDFATPEAMADAVLKVAAGLVMQRELFVLTAAAFPEVAWGPYFTEGQATKAWLDEVGPHVSHGGRGGIVPVHNFPPAYVTGLEDNSDVCLCGHQRWRHTTVGTGRGKARFYCGPKKEGCTCVGFTDPARTA